jgi:hypothetical protein
MRRMEWNGMDGTHSVKEMGVYISPGSGVLYLAEQHGETVRGRRDDGVKMGWIISNLFKTRRRLVWRVSEAARLRCLFPLFIFPGLFRVVWWESLEPLNYR